MLKRQNTRWIKGRKDKKGRLLCLVPTCDKLREKYKNGNFRNYCKNHTYEDMRGFTNWQILREKVLKRDNYTCVKCGDKRKEVELISKQKKIKNWDKWISGREKAIYEISDYPYNASNFIADHIEPIALGGDEWDINNIQTLCQKCNKIKTREDAKKIAKQRRIEKVQEKNQTLTCSLI